jgi:hypothetical protein
MQPAWALILLSFMPAVRAGLIKGVVLDHMTGRPLARTVVRLQPVPGSPASNRPVQIRSGRAGDFQFPDMPAGLYLLVANRSGYFPSSHGQRRPEGQGRPITVAADSQLFSELRMHRIGAITGTVTDENGIGLPGVRVIAYPARQPLRSAGEGSSDDRGVYRISGLPLGKYWLRTAATTLDDGLSIVPTFAPQSHELQDAKVYTIRLDAETTDADVRPF